MLALDSRVDFDPQRAEEFLASLPPRPAVVMIEPRSELAGARPLLLRTADLRRKLQLLLGPPDPASKRVNLREFAKGIRFRVTGSAFEQSLVHWQHARVLWPRGYRQRLRLRPLPLLKLTAGNPYPRAYVTRRIGASGVYFGPFSKRRSAETFLNQFLDLFRIRRCQIRIRRDPEFPGCIYSEMKMCLAPCFAGCTAEQYAVEAGRVLNFLESRGGSLTEQLVREREEASAQTDFERAAASHRRLEKVETLLRLMPDLARCVDTLDAIVLQRAAEKSSVAMFVVRGGHIAEPFLLRFAQLASQPRSAEQILRNLLEPPVHAHAAAGSGPVADVKAAAISSVGVPATEREDHLAILGRWFYGRPRLGEVFWAETRTGSWPYRRILRACSRVLAAHNPAVEKTVKDD